MFKQAIIAAIRREEDVTPAIEAKTNYAFLMFGEINGLAATVGRLKTAGKQVFVHIDLIKGLASDKEAIDFIARQASPTGVVTTKGHLIKEIQKQGLIAIHQLFMIDTQAFHTAVKSVHASNPDAVEIMPGMMPRVVREWKASIKIPLVVAGLIKDEEEVRAMLQAGCQAVAVGDSRLWNIEIRETTQ